MDAKKHTRKGKAIVNNSRHGSTKPSLTKSPRSPNVNKKVKAVQVTKEPVKRRIILKKDTPDKNNNAKTAKVSRLAKISSADRSVKDDNLAEQLADCNPDISENMDQDHVKLVVSTDDLDDDFLEEEVEYEERDEQDIARPSQVQNIDNGQTQLGVQQFLVQCPELQMMMQRMVEQGVKNALEQAQLQTPPARMVGQATPVPAGKMGIVERVQVNRIKSPADTTIYAPALKMNNNPIITQEQQISQFVENI